MTLARVVSHADPADLDLAFARMALPSSAREYLFEKLPTLQVLLTGLEREQARFLRSKAESSEAPGREEYPSFVAGDQRKRPGSALLSGRRDQFDRLLKDARSEPAMTELVSALESLERALTPPGAIELGGRLWAFGERVYLMGIVNVTPDSFSDGGRFFDPEAAIAHGVQLAQAGADMLDVGGESTRPGSGAVSEDEELRRVIPVIQALRERVPEVPISIDTRKSGVAREAVKAGAVLVNDVTGFRDDRRIVEVIAETGAAACAMHIQGTPETMQKEPRYEDLLAEIIEFLAAAVERAVSAGVRRERVFVDPGIGFGKTFAHNHFVLRRLNELRVLGLPVLLGPSRKAFLGALTGGKPAPERIVASAACVAAAVMTGGADVVRVHDVAEVRDALAVAQAMRFARDGGALFQAGQL